MKNYFKRKEFACKCGCGFDVVDYKLLYILNKVRKHFKSPVIITSGCRCSEYNKKIGGVKKSQHLFGKAVDIKVVGIKPSEVYKYLDDFPGGLGSYETFTHKDVGSTRRWEQ